MVRKGTEVFYGVDDVMRMVLQFLYQSNGKIDACVDYTHLSLAFDIVVLKEAFLDAKKRGVKLRCVTEITKDNISYCKQTMKMVDELRHIWFFCRFIFCDTRGVKAILHKNIERLYVIKNNVIDNYLHSYSR
jgi:hypothetical protein